MGKRHVSNTAKALYDDILHYFNTFDDSEKENNFVLCDLKKTAASMQCTQKVVWECLKELFRAGLLRRVLRYKHYVGIDVLTSEKGV